MLRRLSFVSLRLALPALAIMLGGGLVPDFGKSPAPVPISALKPIPAVPSHQTSASLQSRRTPIAGPYGANVLRVVDGDTFEATIHVWFGQDIATLVRIRGIDAPELKAQCADEAGRALAAKDLLADFLLSGAVRLHNIASDKFFGRVVASVEIAYADGQSDDLASLMLGADMARPYEGRARGSWCNLALAAH